MKTKKKAKLDRWEVLNTHLATIASSNLAAQFAISERAYLKQTKCMTPAVERAMCKSIKERLGPARKAMTEIGRLLK